MTTGHVLLDILILLVAAKAAAEGAERLGLPAVLGEIVAGVLIGPSLLGLVHPSEVLSVLGELGVILLLVQVGMETDLKELGKVGKSSMLVAVAGVVVPFGAGWGAATALGHGGNAALFVGAALTATSVGITARVFGDLRALATKEARIVLGAAVADDVIGLVILTVVSRIATEGSVSLLAVAGVIGVAIGFLVLSTAAGTFVAPRLFRGLDRRAKSSGTVLALALAFALAFAELASLAKLAPIVGAFVAGVALGRTDDSERIGRELLPLTHVFVPVFFLQIGIEADVQAMIRPSVLGLAAILGVIGIVGKVVAGWLAPRTTDRLLIGLGMIPRGEVGLIFASIGLRLNIFDDDLYAAVLVVVLVTTLITPPLLRWRTQQRQLVGDPTRSDHDQAAVESPAEPIEAADVSAQLDPAKATGTTSSRPEPVPEFATAANMRERQAALASLPGGKQHPRVQIFAVDDVSSIIDIAARDQSGLLAALTQVLAAADLDVVDATMSSWGDKVVVATFTVRHEAGRHIRVAEIETEILPMLRAPLWMVAPIEARMSFDDTASPWLTHCLVEAIDRPNLLADLATLFTQAGVRVHSATVHTADGMAFDNFVLSTKDGRKLPEGSRKTLLRGLVTTREPLTRWKQSGRQDETTVV